MPATLPRSDYAAMYGPTTGDKVRLADTDLIIEVERDLTTYGEEVKFGGGKVIRDGMGQSQVTRAEGAVDTVITNALIVDYWGIVKADIGMTGRPHRCHRQGRQPGHASRASTSSSVPAPKLSPAKARSSLPAVLTATFTSSARSRSKRRSIRRYHHARRRHRSGHGTNATTCTPGAWHIGRMLQAFEAFPMNLGLSGKGNASLPAALEASGRRRAR